MIRRSKACVINLPTADMLDTVVGIGNTSGATIDAMDLLHSGQLDGFCLVSSDSDFTRLATRLRESGVAVYGFGEHKTPEPFVAACDRFMARLGGWADVGDRMRWPYRSIPAAEVERVRSAAHELIPEFMEGVK